MGQQADGRFVFNQEVRIKEEGSRLCSEMNVCLVTEKGAKYISGMVKIYHS